LRGLRALLLLLHCRRRCVANRAALLAAHDPADEHAEEDTGDAEDE
jgi:hypothetical protein